MKRVLIVEDDETILWALGASLRDDGYVVLQAHNWCELFSTLHTCPVDAIVLDLMMPDFDGFDLLCTLHTHQHIPVIVISALGEGARKQALAAGADVFLTKPFDYATLVRMIETLARS